ncbi:MAG TPA: hypothetical protein VLW48_00135, partial [Candidatus Bathyarchaeia archaeon]|nr:hypothetical protein [Candidatus Bathyarchaeia archaeon]
NKSAIELDDDVDALPAGTRYHLYRTTYNAFQLNAATIERFANNVGISTTGPFRNAAIEENGKVTIQSLSGNVFQPYKCAGACAISYNNGAKLSN